MAETTTALLTSVETAISTVLTAGQSYRIGNVTYTRADLRILRDWRDDLKRQLDGETNGRARNYAQFKRAI